MKTSPVSIALLLALGSVAVAAADPAAPVEKVKVVQVAPEKTKKVALTGSYIKRTVQKNGQITDGPSPVLVLDGKSIRTSGAADLKQLLARQGVGR